MLGQMATRVDMSNDGKGHYINVLNKATKSCFNLNFIEIFLMHCSFSKHQPFPFFLPQKFIWDGFIGEFRKYS